MKRRITRLKVGAVARAAGISEQLVRDYANAGLLDCELDSSGHRLFDHEAPAQAREIRESRQRGRQATA